MKGKHHYEVLSGIHTRDELKEHAKNNGVYWEPSSHEGVDWMRASKGIINHIDAGREFETHTEDLDSLESMHNHYSELREHHKQSMIPHIRSAMGKLHADSGDPSAQPMDYLHLAHEHLQSNGGSVWAEKLHLLHHYNHQISKLSEKIDKAKSKLKDPEEL